MSSSSPESPPESSREAPSPNGAELSDFEKEVSGALGPPWEESFPRGRGGMAALACYFLIANGLFLCGLLWFEANWDVPPGLGHWSLFFEGDLYAYGPYGAGGRLVPHPFVCRTLWYWAFAGCALNAMGLLALFERRIGNGYAWASWEESRDPHNPWCQYLFHSRERERRRWRIVLFLMWWLFAPMLLGSFLYWSLSENPRDSWLWLRDGRWPSLIGAGLVSLFGPVAGILAQRRIMPLAEESLATTMGQRDYAVAIHGTVLEWTFFAQRAALFWWVISVNARALQFRWAREFWAEHPAQLVCAGLLLGVWAANFVAGFYLRATAAATIPLFRRFPPVAFLALNGSAYASVMARFMGLIFLFNNWPPMGWAPEWMGPLTRLGPGGAAEIFMLATIFEGCLALGRFILARELWRRLVGRDPIEEFGKRIG